MSEPRVEQPPPSLSFAATARLVDALLACPSLADPQKRQVVVSLLPAHIAASTPVGSTAKGDVLNLVQTSLRYPHGLEQFLEIVRFLEGPSLPRQSLDRLVQELFHQPTTSEVREPIQRETQEARASSAAEVLERLDLLEQLSALPAAALDRLRAALRVPNGVLPSAADSPEDWSLALLTWAEGPEGPGVTALAPVVRRIEGARGGAGTAPRPDALVSGAPGRTITWLHLSDLHLRRATEFNSQIVRNSLLMDLRRSRQDNNPAPDLILFSGDLAFSGTAPEYELAAAFLDELLTVTGVDKRRLFLVPGNHDVDRQAITVAAAGAPNYLNNREAVNQALDNPDDRSLQFRRLRGYGEFINTYFAGVRTFDEERYFHVERLQVGGVPLAVLCLNSAWLCAGDEDRNRLVVGERQVRAALDAAGNAELKIAMLHHPFDWLQDFDRSDVEPLLTDRCDFVLRGHMHQLGLLQARSPDAEAMVIAAGAVYETRDHPNFPNSYNLVQLDPAAGKGTVYLRMYTDQRGGFWTEDVVNYRGTRGGLFSFDLPRPAG
jgi:predicted MPP superfamily phosphohydrolase